MKRSEQERNKGETEGVGGFNPLKEWQIYAAFSPRAFDCHL